MKFAARAKSRDRRRKSAIMQRKRRSAVPIRHARNAKWVFQTLEADFFLVFPAREASSYQSGSLRPRQSPRHAVEKSRPLSRVLSWTVIPLGCASPRSSSDLPGSPMWATCCGRPAPRASLFGLAPGGVCRAADVATRAVRSYRTISPLPAPLARHLGGIFLLHFP